MRSSDVVYAYVSKLTHYSFFPSPIPFLPPHPGSQSATVPLLPSRRRALKTEPSCSALFVRTQPVGQPVVTCRHSLKCRPSRHPLTDPTYAFVYAYVYRYFRPDVIMIIMIIY